MCLRLILYKTVICQLLGAMSFFIDRQAHVVDMTAVTECGAAIRYIQHTHGSKTEAKNVQKIYSYREGAATTL